jgi:hypothetical protein
MSETIYEKVIKETLKELTEKIVNEGSYANKIVNSYLQDQEVEALLLIRSGEKEEELKDYFEIKRSNSLKLVIKSLIETPEAKDSLYKKSYEYLKAFERENKSYGDLFTEIYEDNDYLNEIFVRIVEEQEKVTITSAKQLQELTEITEIYGYWDEDKGETIPYGDKKPTKKEAQEIAFKEVEGTFITAMSYRYSMALENILKAGGNYKDLLQIKPSYFNLSETWSGGITTDQYSSILWAIINVFRLTEPTGVVRPDLKTIAQDIEAPYSALIDAYKISNTWKLQS